MIIDASVWVASVLAGDTHHASALAFLREFVIRRHAATLPSMAWPEIAGAVARRTGDTAIALEVTEHIAAQPWVRSVALDASLARAAMRLAAGLRLRGADAVYVALAAAHGLPLIMLDAEMIARGGDAAEVLTPEQWLQNR